MKIRIEVSLLCAKCDKQSEKTQTAWIDSKAVGSRQVNAVLKRGQVDHVK